MNTRVLPALVKEDDGETEGQGSGASKRPRILVVEDNEIALKVIVVSLLKADVIVDAASNGTEALTYWKGAQYVGGYSLVISDLLMPELGGLELARRIRQMETGEKRVPMIAVSAQAGAPARAQALEAGFDLFLKKPIGAPEVRNALRLFLQGVVPSSSPLFQKETLLDAVGGDVAAAREIESVFRKQGLDDLAEALRQLQLGELEGAIFVLRRLGQSARSVGALEVACRCQALTEKTSPKELVRAIEGLRSLILQGGRP
jgi:CheY-like chemotaxis protein